MALSFFIVTKSLVAAFACPALPLTGQNKQLPPGRSPSGGRAKQSGPFVRLAPFRF